MARIRKISRRNCLFSNLVTRISLSSSRKLKSIINTPKRVRLLTQAQSTTGTIPHTELFKLYDVSQATDYRILNSNSTR